MHGGFNRADDRTAASSPLRTAVQLFLTCWLIYSLHWAPWLVREHFPAWALAESGSLNVQTFLGWNDDIFPGQRGGAWINNSPGASILGAVPLVLGRPLLRYAESASRPADIPLPPRDAVAYRRAFQENRFYVAMAVSFLTAVFLMAPLSALAAALLFLSLERHGLPHPLALVAALAYAFATPVFFRTLYLNHNLIVGQLSLIAFLLLQSDQRNIGRPPAAGALAGFTMLCDFTGFLVCAALAVWCLARLGWRRAMVFSLAAAPGALGLMAYQFAAFGNALLPPQHYMIPTAPTSIGYRGFHWPSPTLAWANLFEPRWGLLAYCPLLALAFVAPWVRAPRWKTPRSEAVLVYGLFAAMFLLSAANHYSWLQWTTGFRYLLPTVPGFLLLSLQTLSASPRWLIWLALALSALHQWFIAMTYQYPAEAWRRVLGGGIDFAWLREFRRFGLCAEWYWSPYLMATLACFAVGLIWRRPSFPK